MKKKIFSICSRTTLVCFELVAVVIGVLFLIGGVLAWRLMTGPVDIGFAKNYIEQTLHDPVSGYSVSLDTVVVEWPDFGGPLMLDLTGVDVIKDNTTVVGIENVSLGLATRYLFIGAIKPVSIILDPPSLNLIRTAQNEIRFSIESDEPETKPDEDTQGPLTRIIAMISEPEGERGKISPLDNLQSIQIKDADMVIADYLLGITWFLSPLDLSFARDPQGLIITANAELPGGRDKASHIQTDLVYLQAQDRFVANIHVQDFDPHILSRKIEELDWLNDHYAILNGNIELGFDTDFHVHSASVSLSSTNGEILLNDVYDNPLPFEELFLNASYDEEQGTVSLKDLSLKSRGVSVSMASDITFTDSKISAPVTIKIPDLPQGLISPLWPDALRGEGAEIWLTQKLSKGRIHDVATKFFVQAEKKDDLWSIDVQDIVGDFLIENMDIDYRAPLRPITNANGSAHFEKDILTIHIAEGKLGSMNVNKGQAVISKIIEGGGHADINVDLSGPIQSVLRYIQPEPIGVSEDDLGLDIAAVKGDADLSVNVRFPAVRDLLAEQVIVKADGKLKNVLLPDVVKKFDLTGGPFDLRIAGGAASISGKGKLEGRDISFSWKEYISPDGKPFVSQVNAELVADKDLRDGLGVGLDGWIDGAFPTKVTYTEYGGGRAEADVNTDLGPGQVMIGPLDYIKKPGLEGTATCKVIFRNGFVQEVQNLNVEASPLRIEDAHFVFDVVRGGTEMRRASVPEFFLEENQLDIDLEVAQSGLMKISVTGPFLDVRPFFKDKKEKKQYDGPPLIVSVAVDRARTHPARMIDRVKVYLDMDRKGDINQFEMDGIAGKGDIYLRLKPNDQGIMAIRLEADDAGETLKAFGVYENLVGGKLKLYGEAKGPEERKALYGNAELTDFRIVKAPALAQLLSAISLFGIQQLLGGEGIYFSKLESKFEWHMDRGGDSYYFKEGRTSGSSLGLTFEGRIIKAEDLIRMEGTIVPVSMVNELIGNIPLIGDILTGGGGGVIAATYSLEGPIKKPEVTVNPLSALAPGILRKILFE